MSLRDFRRYCAAITLPFFILASQLAASATIPASSCQLSSVQSAISSAADGDVVTVPAGSCSWSSFTISKGIHLAGAGIGATNITLNGSMTVRKNATRNVEVSGFSFSKNGGGESSRIMYVDGAWNAEPPLIHDNMFTVSNAGTIRYETNGGVIYKNTFRGTWDDSGIQHKIGGDVESWMTADTMGNRDSSGKRNLYVEDNVFEGMANQATDFDDGSRIVFRHNRMVASSFNSHGLATSPIGVRHFEIYDNEFTYPNDSVNQNWHIWLRGGTGVIFNNSIENIVGEQWGDKTELELSVRAAVDGGVRGCCTSWPCPHQIGQNHNGSAQFTDAVRIWNNTGNFRWGRSSDWSNTCGQNISNYLQEGRDFVFQTSAKNGYTPYTYPHPLRSGTVRPMPPRNFTIIDP